MNGDIEIKALIDTDFSQKEVWDLYYKEMLTNAPSVKDSLRLYFNPTLNSYGFGTTFLVICSIIFYFFGPFYTIIFAVSFVFLSVHNSGKAYGQYLSHIRDSPSGKDLDTRDFRKYYNDSFFVAIIDGELAGGTALDIQPSQSAKGGSTLELRRVFVHSKCRRRGIANKLMERVEEYCEEKGVDSNEIFLYTSSQQYAAFNFYLKKGFKFSQKLRWFSERGLLSQITLTLGNIMLLEMVKSDKANPKIDSH